MSQHACESACELCVQEVHDIASLAVDTSTRGTQWGTGGMATKLTAARIVGAAGCRMAICNSKKLEAIEPIMLGQPLGTVFHAATESKVTDRKRWILSGASTQIWATVARRHLELLGQYVSTVPQKKL